MADVKVIRIMGNVYSTASLFWPDDYIIEFGFTRALGISRCGALSHVQTIRQRKRALPSYISSIRVSKWTVTALKSMNVTLVCMTELADNFGFSAASLILQIKAYFAINKFSQRRICIR